MDLVDMAQEFEIPMIRATIKERCKICLVTMAPHLLEDGVCIDCDTMEG